MSHNISSSISSSTKMLTKRQSRPLSLAKQQGSALVMGVFVITVVFLLAASLINVLEDADEQVNLEVWGTRAFAAANSGADYALAQLLPLDGSVGQCKEETSDWNPPTEPGFHQCSVTFKCKAVSFPASGFTQYLITSTAICETGNCNSDTGSCLRVSRKVEVEARD